jgi:chromosomal replication initiator protein
MSISAVGVRAQDVRQDILATLADRIGPQKFNAWFKTTTRVDIQDDHVKLSVPNPFVASWIGNHFMDDLEQAVRDGLGKVFTVTICVDPSLSSQFRRRQLDTQACQVARSTSGQARASSSPMNGPLRHRLDTFVVGPSNQLAHSAALAVATATSAAGKTGFNPLFIHGGCGMGKTHLLQGVCNAAVAKANGRPAAWRYVTGEQFTNEFIHAIKSKSLEAFRATYRKLDLLVIDDVHFLAAKRATQEEFLHTFNTIDGAGKQVVMASDAHPKLVGQLTEQLVSRFISGMVVKIDPPDHATRVKILRLQASKLRMAVPEEVLDYVAMHIRGNVRELEGTLIKLTALASLNNKPISLALASEALADHLAQTESALTLGDIERIVAAYFAITPADIHSSRRTRTVSLARMIAMTLARRHTQMSFPEIARFMGKNHSSAVLAVQRMEKLLAANGSCTWMTPAGQRSAKAKDLLKLVQEQLP